MERIKKRLFLLQRLKTKLKIQSDKQKTGQVNLVPFKKKL